MPDTTAQQDFLTLTPVSGPTVEPIVVPANAPVVIGRSSACAVSLTDETMSLSRRHTTVFNRGGTWFIADLGSRHGTWVNGVRLEPDTPTVTHSGDHVRIGPWIFAVRTLLDSRDTRLTSLKPDSLGTRVERLSTMGAQSLAQHRLDLLIDLAGSLAGANSVRAMAEIALETLVAGAKFPRASILRETAAANTIEVVAMRSLSGKDDEDAAFSRTLLREASRGEAVRLRRADESSAQEAVSIIQQQVDEAICAPVHVGPSIAAYLYLDARGPTERLPHDAQTFAQAVARMCGLALSNIQRADLEKRTLAMEKDLSAAREAQRLLMPPEHGSHGALSYAMRMRSGRFVAGDLFDLIPYDDGAMAVVLGDVAGKGIGAAILMAAAQSRLSSAFQRLHDAARAVQEVNSHVVARSAENSFITLWAGVIDPTRRVVRFVDAGHGHWLYKPPGEEPHKVRCEGGLVLGVREHERYAAEALEIAPGARLILFSDGIVEQQNEAGEEFGVERVIRALTPSASPGDDIESIFEALREFAGTDALADDATIASIELAF